MAEFEEVHHDINGVDTAVFTAGDGEPLVFFHGGGTAPGFDKLLPLAEHVRLILPHHPGFGASADMPTATDVHDYVRHYLDLFDRLGLDDVSIAGHSFGGHVAATMAMYIGSRIPALVLIAPLGLRSREHPTVDLLAVPDEEVFSYLTVNPGIMDGKMTMPPSPEFLADRYREATSIARLYWERPYDLKLERWLHRLTMPTRIMWGDADRLIPVEQAAEWAALVPNASVQTFPGVGHLMFDEDPGVVAAVAAFVRAPVSAPAG